MVRDEGRPVILERSNMHVAESSVRYPITVIVRVLLVIVFGYVCLKFLSVELKPDTEQPILVVVTTFPGAAPEDVEGEITTRFEESISGVSNMLYTQSYSAWENLYYLYFINPGQTSMWQRPNSSEISIESKISLGRLTSLKFSKQAIESACLYINLP